MRLRQAGDGAPAVIALAGVGAVRRSAGMSVAAAFGLAPHHGPFHHRRGEEVQRGFKLRHVDVLAAPGAAAVVQRGDDGGNGETRHDEVRVGAVRIGRRPVRPAGQAGHAAERRQHRAETRLPRVRAAAAQHRSAEQDDVGLDGAQVVVAEAPFLQRAGGEILGDQIGPGDQPLDNLDALGMRHVEAEAELVGVVIGVVGAAVRPALAAAEGRGAAQHLGAQLGLDAHHRGAVFRQVAGGHGTDGHPAEIQNLQALQGTHAKTQWLVVSDQWPAKAKTRCRHTTLISRSRANSCGCRPNSST